MNAQPNRGVWRAYNARRSAVRLALVESRLEQLARVAVRRPATADENRDMRRLLMRLDVLRGRA